MVLIGKILVSSELLECRFACDISECKGFCCCEGYGGAPLEPEETVILENIFPVVSGYLRTSSVEKIIKNGFWTKNLWGTFETSLADDGWCVFAVEKNGTVYCGIELAWQDKKVSFRKPVSCHLYPVRIRRFGVLEGLVFEHWDICRCKPLENAPLLFEFVSQALERKYGKEFVTKLYTIKEKNTARTK